MTAPSFRNAVQNAPDVLETVLRRDRLVVRIALVFVIAACWWYLLAGARTGMYPHEMSMLSPGQMRMEPSLPAAWTPRYALLILSMWWLMMIAMMLPSAAPMILLHAAVTRKGLASTDGVTPNATFRRLHSTIAAFTAGYLFMWGAFSVVAVVTQWALERFELLSGMMTVTNAMLGASLLLVAGVWQLTPVKTTCLRHCRSPISFLSAHWRPGVGGAFRMGVEHGAYCLGCCWFLMTLLFYAGVMNLIWLVGLASIVLLEKTMPGGIALGRATGVLLIAWGLTIGYTAF